ncbi:MAG: AAA family ATPase [Dysgonamonadaceae bacterium]|jgi:predicted AAA+ superfamily ATPase|nr:AAA family ATPase [Dysgonamonadaceae bacterium]
MDSLYKSYRYLLDNTDFPIRRKLAEVINWNDRLICICGSRGTGKTRFLLQYAKDRFSLLDRECLYINMDNFYFTVKTLRSFAQEFIIKGGKVLLIDNILKYPDWAAELSYCYDNCPGLQIIFTNSSIMLTEKEHSLLAGKVVTYRLWGFSFREFLELQTGHTFDLYTLSDIIRNHTVIAHEIVSQIRPLAYFDDYLQEGFYHFLSGKQSFKLLKMMNRMLEVDLAYISQIEQRYLPKIRKLLYLLLSTAPSALNVSQLSLDIDTSRATVMNYIKYLEDIMLVNLLYPENEEFPKKPVKLYLQNPNLLYTANMLNINRQSLIETFFYNQLVKDYKVNATNDKYCHFLIDGKYYFSVGKKIIGTFNSNVYYAIDGIETGELKVIPLWLFGFLY